MASLIILLQTLHGLIDNSAPNITWLDCHNLNDWGRMEIDHVFASGVMVGRATTHSRGCLAPYCMQSDGRPHSCVVARPTMAPDAKTWSIPTSHHTFISMMSNWIGINNNIMEPKKFHENIDMNFTLHITSTRVLYWKPYSWLIFMCFLDNSLLDFSRVQFWHKNKKNNDIQQLIILNQS